MDTNVEDSIHKVGMAKVAASWGSSGSVPGPDRFVPRASEDQMDIRGSQEGEGGQRCRRCTIHMG